MRIVEANGKLYMPVKDVAEILLSVRVVNRYESIRKIKELEVIAPVRDHRQTFVEVGSLATYIHNHKASFSTHKIDIMLGRIEEKIRQIRLAHEQLTIIYEAVAKPLVPKEKLTGNKKSVKAVSDAIAYYHGLYDRVPTVANLVEMTGLHARTVARARSSLVKSGKIIKTGPATFVLANSDK